MPSAPIHPDAPEGLEQKHTHRQDLGLNQAVWETGRQNDRQVEQYDRQVASMVDRWTVWETGTSDSGLHVLLHPLQHCGAVLLLLQLLCHQSRLEEQEGEHGEVTCSTGGAGGEHGEETCSTGGARRRTR